MPTRIRSDPRLAERLLPARGGPRAGWRPGGDDTTPYTRPSAQATTRPYAARARRPLPGVRASHRRPQQRQHRYAPPGLRRTVSASGGSANQQGASPARGSPQSTPRPPAPSALEGLEAPAGSPAGRPPQPQATVAPDAPRASSGA